ncbi:MAG: septum formation protein Maf [Betaproteobacteria bacterium RIFCSPLOWO2_02_67_12]|nr:MAG: septum formation protein Maf [Betaproteobacteria bacterium RIFCSPLOWO2_02_67_12]OGA30905.1 MAG: septum formation protein Maf [Betaproteobacteria bacterium RIFCSPLOWO2_02_FULL_68_150]OGA72233.1 MAG: septum formation protein Maf [Betaproteobacteria bacterium RIFCSPLOWO2_12_FULL_67_28]
MAQSRSIVLASTSNYRRALLARLRVEFECAAPQVAESVEPGETPATAALRLAVLKARAVAPRFAGALIVGSDQVASCDGVRLGKPGHRANAIRQLEHLSGKVAEFATAVCVLDAATGVLLSRLVPCRVTFRPLGRAQIEAYVDREQPYDCAGSAKSEGLGIALLARIETDDPTSLVGLPLIALTELLAEAGLPVLA